MNEATLQRHVLAYIKLRGLTAYHTFDSRHSEPGFPDLVIVGGKGVIFRELKSARGLVSAAQMYWLNILVVAGQDAAVWRPVDWPANIKLDIDLLGRLTYPPPMPTQAQVRASLQKRGMRPAQWGNRPR